LGRRALHPFEVKPHPGSPYLYAHFVAGGHRYRVSTGESEREAAQQRAVGLWAKAKARAGDPVRPEDAERPLKMIAAELHAQALTMGRADTYARDLEIDLRLHVLTRWDSVSQITSAEWKRAMIDIHAEGHKWGSVTRIAKHLRLLLRYAVDVGAIQIEPVIRSPEKRLIDNERAQRSALSAKDRNRLLADMLERENLRAHRCYTVMLFGLFRKSTVQRMARSWIDWKARTITVPPSKSKTSKERVYWMHARTVAAVRAQLKVRGDIAPSVPIFGKFDHSNVFWGACKRLGIATLDDKRGLTAHHVARKTSATMLVDAGVSTKDRMAAGGWDSVAAAELYDHGDEIERSKRALKRLR